MQPNDRVPRYSLPTVCLALSFVLSACAPLRTSQPSPSVVTIVASDAGKEGESERQYTLLRNGKPYVAKGVGGGRARLDEFAALGGNSIRSWSVSRDYLDRAQSRGLTVMAGLPCGKKRSGFDYSNDEAIARQVDRHRRMVRDLKDHPALLFWAVGNEVELDDYDDPEGRTQIWKALGQSIEMIREEDPNHPVAIVLAGYGGRNKTPEELAHFPDVDILCINTYGNIDDLPENLKRLGWTQPYMVTEFGPWGHWQVAKTSWGLPIEQSSTEKAESYRRAYESAIANQPNCLGSYAFLWGNKQEKTHTWYGMLLPPESLLLGPVEAMAYCWNGEWPENRAPQIQENVSVALEGEDIFVSAEAIFPVGAQLDARIKAHSPDGDPKRIEWDLRVDVSDNQSTGGDSEPSVDPIAGSILEATGETARVVLPNQPGNYRLFVYVFDDRGYAATGNLPVRVVGD